MSQEQAYFDNNNSFELVTKVQNQLEQIELGLGDKFGYIIQMCFTVITGITISFLVSYKLSLIVTSIIYIAVAIFVRHVILTNHEFSKLLKYSENVQIRELKKEKEDYESMNKEKLFKKFHLI